MAWPILMLAQNVLAALFAVNLRVIAKRFAHAALPLNVLAYGLIASTGLFISLLFGWHEVMISEFSQFIWIFVAAGLCFALTNILSFMVFQYVDAALGTLLATLNIISTVILSSSIIHEGLTPIQLVGGGVLSLSMLFILRLRFNSYRRLQLWLGFLLSIAASIVYGVAMTMEKYLLNHVTLPTYLTFGWGFQLVGVGVMVLIFGRALKADFALLKQRHFWHYAVPASLLRASGGLLFVLSLKLANNLSVISVFSGLKVLLAAVFAVYLLQEREYMVRKYEAALLAFVGVALMLWA